MSQAPPPATTPPAPPAPPAPLDPPGTAAPPAGRRGILADLTPLRVSPAFRRTFLGLSLANVGQQLAVVAIGLQVYALTSSTFAVGLVGLCGLGPLIGFGLWAGSVLDVHDRRRVALLASVALWVLSLTTTLQAWLHVNSALLLYLLLGLQSAAYAVSLPARQAIVPRLVPADLLPAANALTGLTFPLGLAAAPLLAGVIISRWGFGTAYTVDTVTYLVALWAIWRLPPIPPVGPVGRAGLASVLEGLRYLRTRPVVRMTFLVDLAAMVFAQPRSLFPAIGAVLLGGGVQTAGLLGSAVAVGSFLAGLLSGRLGNVRRQGLAVLVCVTGWGCSIAAFGLVLLGVHRNGPAHGVSALLWPAAALLVVAGAADLVSAVYRSTILQTATPDAMRGRLQGVFIVVVAGGPRLGDLVAGVLGGHFGEGAGAVLGGLICVLTVIALAAWQRGFARYDAARPTA